MFYEEKMLNGILCRRTSPDGEWIPFTLEEVSKAYIEMKSSFGDPPEFLCMDCYESVSAKVWEEKKNELEDQHKYDFE